VSKFYLTKPLKATALSAAVGSGKTRAATKWMASPANASRNFLYVAPTISLCTQTAGNLKAALAASAGIVRNVHLVNSATVEGEVQGQDGQIEILTTTTLLDILAGILRPELWTVVLDEAFDPATFDTLDLGTNAQEGWAYFSEVFEVDTSDGDRINPKAGKKALVADIADGRFYTAGSKYVGLRPLAAAVSNPARRCELLVTERVAALMRGEAVAASADAATSRLEYSSYVSPDYFAGFESVLFLSALFEQTVLYHLWTKALGVTFEQHPDFPTGMLRDTHAEQGRFLAVGHLLNADDNSSIENLSRNILTGVPGEKEKGQRVLDHVIQTASAHFEGTQFLLQTNVGKGYEKGADLVPRNAVVIPAYAHGLNDFQDVDNVVALCITNPNPQRMQWLMKRTGMSGAEVSMSFRVHGCYQALGRCSIRRLELSTNPKTVLVAGVQDAKFLHSLFPGSLWLGQVGQLPSMRALGAKTSRSKAREKPASRAEMLAGAILAYLESHPELNRISSMALRSSIKSASLTLDLQVINDDFLASPSLWGRAVWLACAPGAGWTKDGGSLVRVTADHFGFQAQI
jgi:DEAD/DEAH box helicase